jgi:HSP20 family protein
MMRSFGVSLADESSFLPRNVMSLAVDVQDAGNAYVIHADVPGMKKDEVKVEVSPDGVLTMTGERKSEKKEEGEGGKVVRMERSYGSFHRAFRLPDHVDASGIKAEMKNGVLQLTVPKKEGAEEKKTVQIDVGGE